MTRAQTNVTGADVVKAQGGIGGGGDRLWVTCPSTYDVSEITAEDIVHDDAITVVDGPACYEDREAAFSAVLENCLES